MSAERLQKILARNGIASRRQAEELIREGRVTVNGAIAEIGDQADLSKDAVKFDGRRIHTSSGPRRYLLVNKPRGVVSTVVDPEGRPTVLDLLPATLRHGLYPVGRLDFDSEGLLLLTDDGDFAQQVAHPRHGCGKTYEVKVKGRPSAASLDRLRRGLHIDGKLSRPAKIARIARPSGFRDGTNSSWWEVTLGEGRNRQIRQMFLRLGHPVSKLRRIAIGILREPDLPPGGWRELRPTEIERLQQPNVKKKPAKRPARKLASKPKTSSNAKAKRKPSSRTGRPPRKGSSSDPKDGPRTTSPKAGPRSGPKASPRAGSKAGSRTGPKDGPRTGPRSGPKSRSRTGPRASPKSGGPKRDSTGKGRRGR